MKTYDSRFEFFEYIGRGLAEWRTAASRGNCRGIDTELFVIRGERGAPCRFTRGIRRRRRVAEEIYVVRLVRHSANAGKLRAHLVGAEGGAGKRTESACVAYRNGQRAALNARHG